MHTMSEKKPNLPQAKDPPPYGSQEYWDSRYKELSTTGVDQERGGKIQDIQQDEEDDGKPLPYHAWYFTYEELRPIILPLILGAEHEIEGDEGGDEECKLTKEQGPICKDTSKDDDPVKHQYSTTGEQEGDNTNDENEEDDDIVEGDESDKVSDEEEEESMERPGLVTDGPISVLEIGCGDVPLGTDLASELLHLDNGASSPLRNIVKRIVCVDYSPTVIEVLKAKYHRASQEPRQKKPKVVLTEGSVDETNAPLEFDVVDARKMPYDNCSMDLILEKGTLDAMLSDKTSGHDNCVKIVSECARVLAPGGAIVLISHLNAHTPNGIEWLENVVFAGLRSGGHLDASWIIEVHGNDGIPDEEDQEGDDVEGTLGPAVYIIHKRELNREGGTTQEQTIPVRFFSY